MPMTAARQTAGHFRDLVVNSGIRLRFDPPEPALRALSCNRLAIEIGRRVIPVPFDDEYEEARFGSLLSALNRAVLEIREVTDAADYLVWADERGDDPASPALQGIYTELCAAASQLPAGLLAAPLAGWFDFELANGNAQAMREIDLPPEARL